MKIFVSAFAAIVALILLLLAFLLVDIDSYSEELCNRLENIASDETKVAYARDWVEANSSDPSVIALFEGTGALYSSDNSRMLKKVKFDWELLGIKKEFASMSFDGAERMDNGKLNLSSAKAFSVGEGRSHLIFALVPEGHPKVEGSRKLSGLGNGIYLYCD